VRIDFHPAATEELERSAAWYEQRSQLAAQRFAIAIDEALSKVATDPERFIRIDAQHRSCSVKDFPFQVVFRHANARVIVVAIAHAKRRPHYWRLRH
jgi:plasmid stabilization system protein ParE